MTKRHMNLKAIPPEVLKVLQERKLSCTEILELTPEQMFIEYCEWNGLINWGQTLWNHAKTLSKLE